MTVIRYILAALAGYLLGTVSFSNIMAKCVVKKDIRTMGSGNAGATNVLRNMGLVYFIPVFVGDACKAIGAALLGAWIIGKGFEGFTWPQGFTQPQVLVGGVAAVLGHNFPVWMRFKGGKGVSCSLGVLCVLNPIMGFCFILLAALINTLIKIYSIVSILTLFLGALVFTLFDAKGEPFEIAALWFLFALTVFMHRQNILRIFKGQEKKINIQVDTAKREDK